LGTLYAWSIFVAPLEKEFHWKRADICRVWPSPWLCLLSPLLLPGACRTSSGPSGSRSPARVLVSLGFFLCAYTTSLMYLFICFGVIGGLGNGFGYSTPIPVMAKWFPDKRGLAVGLAVGGYGAGSALFGPLANLHLIPPYGVHTTFKILGGSSWS
jgi:OFA family oxalate/formate antiporter-like MFS transporter